MVRFSDYSMVIGIRSLSEATPDRMPPRRRRVKHRILQVFRAGNGRRGTILVFPELLNVAEGRDVS